MIEDETRDQMARELYNALIKSGSDPKDPPTESRPPSGAAFADYRRRGGFDYTNPDEFMADLVTRTGEFG